jgi:CDP-diacylglycerol--glycerol-3-phosphate 3-phosphatidyltransferase
MFLIVALMMFDVPWAATAAFWLFIVAALTDWLDGELARRWKTVSAFGRFMDTVIDKVLVIGMMIVLVTDPTNFLGHNVIAMVLLLCILCREFAISGLRMAVAVRGQEVPADMGGKVKTFVQLNAIGWLMGARMLAGDYPELFGGDDRGLLTAVRLLGVFLYVLSVILTITSGVAYFRRHGGVLFAK